MLLPVLSGVLLLFYIDGIISVPTDVKDARRVFENIVTNKNIASRHVVTSNWKPVKDGKNFKFQRVGQYAVLFIPNVANSKFNPTPYEYDKYYHTFTTDGDDYAAATIVKDNKGERLTSMNFHTEQYLVNKWNKLNKNYGKKNKNNFPPIIYLYSYLSPCIDCSNLILNQLQNKLKEMNFRIYLSWDSSYGHGKRTENLLYCQHFNSLEKLLKTKKVMVVQMKINVEIEESKGRVKVLVTKDSHHSLQYKMFSCLSKNQPNKNYYVLLVNRLTWLCVTKNCNANKPKSYVRDIQCWKEKVKTNEIKQHFSLIQEHAQKNVASCLKESEKLKLGPPLNIDDPKGPSYFGEASRLQGKK